MSRFKIINNVKIPLTAEENAIEDQKEKTHKENALNKKLGHLRTTRNHLLAETDWWGASDNTMTDAQKKYRQDLRDLTNGLDTLEKINSVTWPTKPGS
jgi:hypothetical protein